MAVSRSPSTSSTPPETEKSEENKENNDSQALIPGLPDEIGELCLLHIPYPYHVNVRSVSSSWNRTIMDPSFIIRKKSIAVTVPFLFVFAFNKLTSRIQWQAIDPRSGRWFLLPPVPCPKAVCPPGFACASLPRQGEVYLLGGMRSDTETPMQTTYVYRTSSNKWSVASPMITARSFFASGTVNGKIMAVGGSGTSVHENLTAVECYHPETDTWTPVAKLRMGLARYDSAVIGDKMYVTEGWTWPFTFSPRGGVYDIVKNTWQNMRDGMKEGWTGLSVVLEGKLFVISEHGDCLMKLYHPDNDTWEYVGGDRFPCEEVRRPFAVSTSEGLIYVVASGLKVGIGRVYEEENGKTSVKWKVLDAPNAFSELAPASCQMVYA
ncbi:F-box/kelch-repeat protein [Melia azedarach]|uniref:F-box/kelch-repeat protein n=1 Tax=Melia azedarach TaxID=155640 RepID=A0ACC1X9B0_MELAZ|nr:F-box/kelch-repeat protein [Melia azedarach]